VTYPGVPSSLVSRVEAVCTFPTTLERARIISGLRWVGLFSNDKIKLRHGNLLDTLCARLETLLKYEQGERDLVMLQHKFIVEWKDGKEVRPFAKTRVSVFETNFACRRY
jgi:hypothetical protein